MLHRHGHVEAAAQVGRRRHQRHRRYWSKVGTFVFAVALCDQRQGHCEWPATAFCYALLLSGFALPPSFAVVPWVRRKKREEEEASDLRRRRAVGDFVVVVGTDEVVAALVVVPGVVGGVVVPAVLTCQSLVKPAPVGKKNFFLRRQPKALW